MFVAGIDGSRARWITFKVELPFLVTTAEIAYLPVRRTNLRAIHRINSWLFNTEVK
jgi:hypothetical protein